MARELVYPLQVFTNCREKDVREVLLISVVVFVVVRSR
jgi:hypothetical protein